MANTVPISRGIFTAKDGGDFLPHVFGYMGGGEPTKLTKPPSVIFWIWGKPNRQN